MNPTLSRVVDILPDEELFSSLVEISSEAIWIIDYRKNTLYWYASQQNRDKYTIPDPVYNDFWSDHLHPDDRDRAVNTYLSARNNPETTHLLHEYRFKGSDKYYVIQDSIKFFRGLTGDCERVMGIWKDMTEMREREDKVKSLVRAIEEERNLFKTVAELSNAAIWDVNFTTGEIVWRTAEKTAQDFGFRDGYTLQDWERSIHPDDRERVIRSFYWSAQHRDLFFETYRIQRKDGTFVSVIDQGTFVRNDAGEPVRAFGSWVDITKEREREEALEKALIQQRLLNKELQQREAQLLHTDEALRNTNTQLIENIKQLSEREFILNQSQRLARIGSWEFDPQTMQMFWSNEMYNICGVDHAYDVNDLNEIYKLFEPGSDDLVKATFQNILLSKNLSFDITARLQTPLGYKKWLRLTGYPVVNHYSFSKVIGLAYDITYFKEAEERLRTSEEKFAKAFRNSPDLMTIVREDNGLIVDVNDKVYTVLGFERDEVIGKISKDFRFFVHEEERSRYYEEYGQKGFIQIECWWYKKDRSIISVLISSSRIKIDEAAYTISVIKDISDRKAAEEKFLKAFELSPDLMLIFRERDMVLVEANSKLETLLGYDRRSLFGLSAFNMDLWADQQARDIYFNDLQQNDVVSVEAVLRRKDRSMFFGSIASERIALAGESHILVSVRDITDKKVAEEKILQREANLNAVINNTGFFVWSLDTDFRITAVNEPFKQYALEVYGLRLHVGNNILQLFSQRMESKQVALWEKWYRQVLSGEILKKQERRNLRDFQYSLSPIKSKDSIMGITVFVEDITAQKEAQEKILENEARLNAIMNNTNMAIWSVDTDGNITAVNKVFQESILKDFNIHCEIGQNIIELMRGHMRQEIADLWIDLYQRCFDGEIVMEEYTTDGVTMRCSLHPIIEHDCVIGASIYAQDITERVQKEEQIRKSAVELAEANKKIGELKLMALRSAMNPHFIFNALNSIQYFIAKNDRQNAISYLSTFSKLIRGILTHAVNTRTSLANELNLLKYYINLEMLRFENKFDVEWNIESNLDLENIEVPSLLIQPFVENAILHGLYNKVGKGILKLTVRTDSDKIWFVVEDNGIGRAAAQALRLQQFPTHQSLGTPLTEERLRLINQRESIAYTVEDLFDADHLPAGTKVSIGIKI